MDDLNIDDIPDWDEYEAQQITEKLGLGAGVEVEDVESVGRTSGIAKMDRSLTAEDEDLTISKKKPAANKSGRTLKVAKREVYGEQNHDWNDTPSEDSDAEYSDDSVDVEPQAGRTKPLRKPKPNAERNFIDDEIDGKIPTQAKKKKPSTKIRNPKVILSTNMKGSTKARDPKVTPSTNKKESTKGKRVSNLDSAPLAKKPRIGVKAARHEAQLQAILDKADPVDFGDAGRGSYTFETPVPVYGESSTWGAGLRSSGEVDRRSSGMDRVDVSLSRTLEDTNDRYQTQNNIVGTSTSPASQPQTTRRRSHQVTFKDSRSSEADDEGVARQLAGFESIPQNAIAQIANFDETTTTKTTTSGAGFNLTRNTAGVASSSSFHPPTFQDDASNDMSIQSTAPQLHQPKSFGSNIHNTQDERPLHAPRIDRRYEGAFPLDREPKLQPGHFIKPPRSIKTQKSSTQESQRITRLHPSNSYRITQHIPHIPTNNQAISLENVMRDLSPSHDSDDNLFVSDTISKPKM